jgi:hypothetical protein
MDIKIARNLVKDTFENGFDKNRFYYFIKNLLNEIEEQDKDRFIYRGNFIPDAYKPYIKTLERIGKYQDSKRNKIDLLIVQLKKETSLEHARTMQRNFIAWYLNGSRGGVLKDAALVAFVSPNQDDWRFSLVRMDYKIVDSGKVKQELTPAKRFSFLVGENEASHTAQSKLAPLIEDDKNNPTLDQLEEVFNIEKVTKEFFEKYRELFLWVKDELEKLVKNDKKIKKDFEQKGVNTVDFAKKLLGQIVFLYFLQKKGWFGVQRDEDWGTGPKDFLRRLFEKQIADYKNFFNEILEPLFYEALARERDDNFYSRFDCNIPFLNGGLFDPLNDYDWVHTDINLPDELFSNLLKTKEGDAGTGILDIFDRFNFTVKEDEPLDKEVAVDPEMLGKVFENLLEVKDRKSKGTYYTPREIVHYMCQQSLINYLATELNDKIKKKDIETLIQLGETAIEHDSHISDNGKETPTYSYKLPESVRKNARPIDEKLAGIKVCDPAIGSGAFPVGMMNIIVKTRNVLNSYIKEEKDRSTYDFKRHAIANSLYGVDIDLGAVEIAKLRLWLSLIVDEQDIKKIKPLPNLDYKIMQGNSLIELLSPDLVRKGTDREKNKLIDQLSELKNQYFEATSRKIKLKLRDQINELIIFIANYDKAKELEHSKNLLANLKAQKSLFSLGPENLTLGEVESKEVKKLKKKVKELEKIKDTSPEDHFEWHLNFNEVFEENSGFDVVIANPPYIGESGNKNIFRPIALGNLGKYHVGKMDIFYYFFHLALDIVKNKGAIAFITTNYYITATGASKLRDDFRSRATLSSLCNFNDLKLFDSARGQHNMLTILKKGKFDEKVNSFVTNHSGLASAALLTTILQGKDELTEYFKLSQNQVFYSNNLMRLAVRKIDPVLDKMVEIGEPLGKLLEVNQGVVSGCDYVSNRNLQSLTGSSDIKKGDGIFVFDLNNQRDTIFLNKLNSNEKKLLRPFFKNSDIGKYWCNKKPSKMLLYSDGDFSEFLGEKYPNLTKHFKKYKSLLKKRLETYSENYHWTALHRPREERIFKAEKILVPYRSKINTFAYNKIEWFCRSDCYLITNKNGVDINIKYVLGLLNSKLYYYWFFYRGKRKGQVLELFYDPLTRVPVNSNSGSLQKKIVNLVNKIFIITGRDGYLENKEEQAKVSEYQKQIDQIVYKLYGLTQEEINIVEKNTK